MTADHSRFEEGRTRNIPWKKWEPYLSERQRGWFRSVRMLALAVFVAALALLGRASCAEEVRTPDATIVVSSSTAASAFGLTLVEGTLRYHDKVYRLTLRGAQPTAGSTGTVYGLGQARNIEGTYTPADGGLRNDRGVRIVFDPPLDLSGGRLHVELSSRVVPKASTGQRGTVD